MSNQKYEFGMIGLGTMGQNFVFNMSDHGYSVAGFDKSQKAVDAFNGKSENRETRAFNDLNEFIDSLKSPKMILMLVPAGRIVDAVISDVKPFLSQEDLLMDCGNSHFVDTDRRVAELEKEGIHFMGIGVSGGEMGARFGPSIMPGGNKKAWNRVSDMLKAVSAKVNGEPCVDYMGDDSAGHYVKMVHNGIEYALMEMISEAYHILKQAGGLNNADLHRVFSEYSKTELQSFLMEITAAILDQDDDQSQNKLIDMILDKAYQNGTGAWTSQDAMNLSVPVPGIDAAVSQREMTTIKDQRLKASQVFSHNVPDDIETAETLIDLLQEVMHFCMIVIYAQGMAQLKTASEKYNYGTDLASVAKIWRGGCIIRSAMLEDITQVYSLKEIPDNMMMDSRFSSTLNSLQSSVRKIVSIAVESEIPVPVLMMCLSYFDSYKSSWLPANMIQAQRDFFGAHTFERIDKEGSFHMNWSTKIQ